MVANLLITDIKLAELAVRNARILLLLESLAGPKHRPLVTFELYRSIPILRVFYNIRPVPFRVARLCHVVTCRSAPQGPDLERDYNLSPDNERDLDRWLGARDEFGPR